MIRKWEMAFWAMRAGTTVMASCADQQLMYGMVTDYDGWDYHESLPDEPDSVEADIPEVLDMEEDGDEDGEELDVEDDG